MSNKLRKVRVGKFLQMYKLLIFITLVSFAGFNHSQMCFGKPKQKAGKLTVSKSQIELLEKTISTPVDTINAQIIYTEEDAPKLIFSGKISSENIENKLIIFSLMHPGGKKTKIEIEVKNNEFAEEFFWEGRFSPGIYLWEMSLQTNNNEVIALSYLVMQVKTSNRECNLFCFRKKMYQEKSIKEQYVIRELDYLFKIKEGSEHFANIEFKTSGLYYFAYLNFRMRETITKLLYITNQLLKKDTTSKRRGKLLKEYYRLKFELLRLLKMGLQYNKKELWSEIDKDILISLTSLQEYMQAFFITIEATLKGKRTVIDLAIPFSKLYEILNTIINKLSVVLW